MYTSAEDSENDDSANADAVQGAMKILQQRPKRRTTETTIEMKLMSHPSTTRHTMAMKGILVTMRTTAMLIIATATPVRRIIPLLMNMAVMPQMKEYSEEAAYYENGAYYDDKDTSQSIRRITTLLHMKNTGHTM